MTNLRLSVESMSCGHCVSRVHQTLSANPGTHVLNVDVGQATLEYDPAVTDPETIAQQLTEGGYPARPMAPAGS